MLGAFWDIVAFLFWIGGTVAAFIIINVVWPATERPGHNEVVGWQLSVIGTSYAVILAFMLFNVWDNFRTADINAHQEANALVNVCRLSEVLARAWLENFWAQWAAPTGFSAPRSPNWNRIACLQPLRRRF